MEKSSEMIMFKSRMSSEALLQNKACFSMKFYKNVFAVSFLTKLAWISSLQSFPEFPFHSCGDWSVKEK
jgi:hypothetical protein